MNEDDLDMVQSMLLVGISIDECARKISVTERSNQIHYYRKRIIREINEGNLIA